MIPYDKRSGKIWYNDELVDWGDVKLHVLSHGLQYASCVFEGERVYDGEIFKLEEHTERLFYSAKRMGIDVPYSQKEIHDAIEEVTNYHSAVFNEDDEHRLMINLTRGLLGIYENNVDFDTTGPVLTLSLIHI